MGKSLANFSIDMPHPGIWERRSSEAIALFRSLLSALPRFEGLGPNALKAATTAKPNTSPPFLSKFVARTCYRSSGKYRRGLKFRKGIRNPKV